MRTNLNRIAAAFTFIVGLSMVMLWTMMYVSGQIPETETEPIRITLHIAAEVATGLMLIMTSCLLHGNRRYGHEVFIFSMGMLVYTLIQSPGYYAQLGQYEFVVMFAAILAIAVIILSKSFTSPGENWE